MDKFVLRISDSFSPETIPMSRAAEYLGEYARLLGENENVHFERISEGSVHMHAFVEDPAAPKVRQRLSSILSPNAPEDVLRAFQRLDEMLAKDNAIGQIVDGNGKELLAFPGRLRPKPAVYGPFDQEGFIEGEIVRIGGTDNTIHITLRDGEHIFSGCSTSKEIAREMGSYLLGPTVRAQGVGKWLRHGDGSWEMKSFRIKSFEVLNETPLSELIAKLRSVPGNDWSTAEDPVGDILRDRGGGSTN